MHPSQPPLPIVPNPPMPIAEGSTIEGTSPDRSTLIPSKFSAFTPVQPEPKNVSPQNSTPFEQPTPILKPKFVPYPMPNSKSNPIMTEIKAPVSEDLPQLDPELVKATMPALPAFPTTPTPPKPLPATYQQPNLKGTYKSKRVFKVIIIGDAGVGKTCLSFRFCNGRFPGNTEATIGVDFRERALVLDNELIRVQLWDTAGQERYRQSIVAHYYRNVNAVVYVYDVTNPPSFRSLPSWISECKKHAVHCSDDTPHILIGNKCDLQAENRVKTDEAQVFADQNDMAHFETSALADSEADHVESIFMTLVHKLRHSKPMHVQTDQERTENSQKLLLKADEAAKLEEEGFGCC